jgi:RNA polymerase sigma factor (sigma-70 family)
MLDTPAALTAVEIRLKAAVGGDSEAFADLVRPCLPAALATATLITGSPADGADAVQDALLSAWSGLASIRRPEAFPAWFRRLVVRSGLRLASRRHRLAWADLDQQPEHESLEHQYRRRVLSEAFDRLEPRDRAILSLRYVSDLNTPEIAATLGIPGGTVKSRLHAAVQRLRAAYEAEERR